MVLLVRQRKARRAGLSRAKKPRAYHTCERDFSRELTHLVGSSKESYPQLPASFPWMQLFQVSHLHVSQTCCGREEGWPAGIWSAHPALPLPAPFPTHIQHAAALLKEDKELLAQSLIHMEVKGQVLARVLEARPEYLWQGVPPALPTQVFFYVAEAYSEAFLHHDLSKADPLRWEAERLLESARLPMAPDSTKLFADVSLRSGSSR